MKRRSFLQGILSLGALAVAPKLSAAPAAPIVQIVRNGIGDYTIDFTQVSYTGKGTYQSPLPNLIINPDMIYIKSREYSSGWEIFDTNPNR